jgi:hypothetical protein
MKKMLLCLLVIGSAGALFAQEILLQGEDYAARSQALIRYVATQVPKGRDETYPKHSAPAYAARLVLNSDTKYALEKLDASVSVVLAQAKKDPNKLDPFDKVALVNAYFLGKDKIPTTTVLKIKDYVATWRHRELEGYAKGAWNYFLMMDGAGFLAAEAWADLVDKDGLDAMGIKAATKTRLMKRFKEIAIQNHGEYGAPIYLAVNLSAVRMVVEFAKDEELRKAATFALDAMLLDIACTWNQGYNVGSASRAKYWYSTDTSPDSMAATATAAWLYFGAGRPIAASGTGWIHSFWMAEPGRYQVPEIIVKIAQDRKAPFTHLSSVNQVKRMTYHTPSYSLCSQWDKEKNETSGLYKESRRQMLKWISPKPSSTFSVCMGNPRRPYKLSENVANALGYGENPFSQYLQHEGTLLGIYQVPANYPYYKLYAPFPTSGSIIKRVEKNGWVFCHNGGMLMAFQSVAPYTWGKKWGSHEMLWVDARKNAWVLETAEVKSFAGGGVDAELERFMQAVISKVKVDVSQLNAAKPLMRVTTLKGVTLECVYLQHKEPYKGENKIEGKAVEYANWPMLHNPWVHQEAGQGILLLSYGGQTLTYDFKQLTRK